MIPEEPFGIFYFTVSTDCYSAVAYDAYSYYYNILIC